jgi:Phage integrase family
LDEHRGSLLVRRGEGGRRGEVGMDAWAWEQLEPWLDVRVELPVGPLFCVVNAPTRGRPWSAAAARSELRHAARPPGVRRRFAAHQLRHAHAVEMAREGVPLIVIQRQLGHTNLGITSTYLEGIDSAEIVDEWASPPDADGLRGLARRAGMHALSVRGVVEPMDGARFVHDALEELGWEVLIAEAQRVKGAGAAGLQDRQGRRQGAGPAVLP